LIAKMDTYEIDNELEQARIDLENEERALERALDTSKKELSVLEAEKKYQALVYEQQTADASLKLALQTIENDYTNKQNEYQQSLRDYEKKLKDYETMKQTYEEIIELDKSDTILYSDEILKTKIEDLKYTADGIKNELDALDKLMIYTDKYGTVKPDYFIYIGAKDAVTKNAVESLFWSVISRATALYTWADTVTISSLSEVEMKSLLIQKYEELKILADEKTELSLAVQKMNDASIESAGVSWSPVSISNGRELKSSANSAIDEIL
jgi:tetratricopeptide (TPR) repeat protein